VSTTPTTFDEASLVAKAQAGDSSAFSELVSRYQNKIYRLAKHITQNDEDAEDVLQEAFLKAYEHLDGFQGNSKFYTWIVRIAVNESLMKLRKRRGDRTVPLDEPLDTGEETVKREIAVWEGNPEILKRKCARSWMKPCKALNRISAPFSCCVTSKS
jgi:RNA polymerase sigma-70 factor (ECF subfamily)